MKIQWVLAVTAVLAVLGVWYTYAVFDAGRSVERARMQILIEEERARSQEIVDAHEADKQQIKVVYREKVKVIQQSGDGCAAAPVPDPILHQLPGGGPAQ